MVPKREIPKRKQVQVSPQQIVWPNQGQKPANYAISKDSLIQQVVFEDEAGGIVVPPAPSIRRSVQTEPFEPINDTPEPLRSKPADTFDSVDFSDSENNAAEIDPTVSAAELGEFAPLDVSKYDFPPISDSPTSETPSAANETPSVSNPTTFASSGSPLNAAANLSGEGLIIVPQQQYPAQQDAQQQYLQNQANSYWNQNQTQQTAYAHTPYYAYGYASPYGTAYVNPYGYGPYGYPNTPGAYWGPTGFVSNPYAAYQGNPYGYRDLAKNADGEKKSSESLSSTTWETLGYFNPLKSPKGPNRGVGGPLMMRSWRDRPFYLGVFGGAMSGGELVSSLVDQETGGTGGIIFGWYCDNYWGLESRLHFAGVPSKDTAAGRASYEDWYKSQNDDTGFIPPLNSRNNAISMFDVSMHYYPLGNAKWRPFLKLGLGSVNQKFRDIYGVKHSYNSFAIPWGVGLKYWWNERIALQMELTDNVLFAVEEAKTQNNVALTVGLNFPIGKVKRKDPVVYWPITPSAGR